MSLYKRKNAKTGVRSKYWSYKFEWAGKQIPRSTLFTDKDDARRAMAAHRLALEKGRFDIADKLRRKASQADTTIGEVLQAYLDPKAPLVTKPTGRRNCANALRNALRRVHGPAADADALSVSAVNSTFVERYFDDATRRVNGAADQAQAASFKRSAGSVLRQGLAVFEARAQRYYRSLALQLPDIEAVHQAVKECRFARVPRHEYAPAPQAVIEATLAAWPNLEDRNMFLSVGLSLAFALRKGEIGQAKWGWLIEGQPLISTTSASVKDSTGRLRIRGLNPFYATLVNRIRAHDWRGSDEEFIIQGTEYYRTWQVFNLVSVWMRSLGWTTQKASHELRAYSGSCVAILDDIFSASLFLRHKSVGLTQTYYCGYVSQAARSNRVCQVSWA